MAGMFSRFAAGGMGHSHRISRKAAIQKAGIEALEQRTLLSGQQTDLVSPAWFAEVAGPSLPGPNLAQNTTGVLDTRWIVQLQPAVTASLSGAVDAASLFSNASFGIQVVRGLGLAGQLLIQTQSSDMNMVSQWLASSPYISSYGVDQVVHTEALPNDPSYSQLWGMNNTGQNGGTPDADIDAPEAWDISKGSASIVVAVIDSGVDYTHPDLAANIWTNPGEIAGNGIDDDGNGFVDDIHGYDFANNDADPMDDNDHGTHVSGTIAGVGDNGVGVVGVNWVSSIMALKFLDASGSGTTSDAIRAVNYATMMRTSHGVNIRVTNNSWGGGAFDQSLSDAIKAGGDAGILFVAAAGNSGTDNDVIPSYPSGYNLSCIIAVAATDNQDIIANFSQYGATTVDLAAPGVDILSTIPGNSYAAFQGTSMASPHVAGVAALAWSVFPASTVDEMKAAVLGGVDPIPGLNGLMVTGGRLNAVGTIRHLGMFVTASDPAAGTSVNIRPVDFTIDFSSPYDPASAQKGDLLVNGIPASSLLPVDSDTITFHFGVSPVSLSGKQTMSIAGGALARASDKSPVKPWQANFFWYNTRPLDIALSNNSVGQNQPTGTVIGALSTTDASDPDTGSNFVYTLIAGTGSADNANFVISGNKLEAATSLSYQGTKSYSVRIRSTDTGGMYLEKVFAIFVDDAPTDITLSNASAPENQPSGTAIGTLWSTDPNVGDSFTYALVSGAGSVDNASFTVSGDQLLTAASFDFESKNSYSIRLRSTDAAGVVYEKALTITVTDVNDAPSDIALSNALLPENEPAVTFVGALSSTDQDARNTFTYSLVPGSGSPDNANFVISGNQLLTLNSFDFETKSRYMIRVRTTDQGGLSFEKTLAIGVKNVNETPMDIGLTGNSVAEHGSAGTAAGTLSTIDPDFNDHFTYTLVSGDGSDDNGSFAIAGDTFVTMASFNYETKDSYSVRVRTTDAGGLYCERALTISVTNINEWPTNLTLSQLAIPEDLPAGSTVGILTATDPDIGNTFTYSVAVRADGPDYAQFTTVGDELRTTGSFDYDGKRAYTLRARAIDQNGLYFEKVFTINVTELPEFGVQQGKVKPVTVTDADGDLVTFKLSGGGSGSVQPDNSVALTDTTANSVLTITVKKARGGDGLFYIQGLTSDGLLKAANAKSVVRSGPLHLNTFGRPAGRVDPVLKFAKVSGAQGMAVAENAFSGITTASSTGAFGTAALLDSDILLGVARNVSGRFAGQNDVL